MEILNKNQRETAVWRLVGFGLIVLATNAVVLFAAYNAFRIQGAGDANDLRKQLDECKNTLAGVKGDLGVKETALIEKEKELKNYMKSKDPEKDALKTKLDIIQTKYDLLERDLNRCQQSQKNN